MTSLLTDRSRPRLSKEDYIALARFRATLRRFLRHSEEGARAAGITPQQHQLLLAVKGADQPWATIAEVADALQISHHAAVGLANRSEAAALVSREPSPDDRRQVRLVLTARGEEILASLVAHNRSELEALQQSLHLPFLQEDGDGPPEAG
ncbi:MAG: MarR family winged helix-turn-helix transcriptional regulator [Actinomycetota bacterium]